jgi:hypothetical protein
MFRDLSCEVTVTGPDDVDVVGGIERRCNVSSDRIHSDPLSLWRGSHLLIVKDI